MKSEGTSCETRHVFALRHSTCSVEFGPAPGVSSSGLALWLLENGAELNPRASVREDEVGRGAGGNETLAMGVWGGSEMVKKHEQHVIVDPTETHLCIFHDILMSTSLKLVCAYLLGHLWGRSSEQSPCFFWHFFQLAETMLSRSAVPENSHKKSNKSEGK